MGNREKPFFEGCAACYNSGGMGGAEMVMGRGKRLTDPDVLATHGGGDVYPLPYGEYAANGNYLESDEIAKRHGICGDPSSVSVCVPLASLAFSLIYPKLVCARMVLFAETTCCSIYLWYRLLNERKNSGESTKPLCSDQQATPTTQKQQQPGR